MSWPGEVHAVAWVAQPDPPQYAAEGEMISRPQRMTEPCEQGRVFWQADMPEGTSVRLQVRSAADRDGGPRDWTPFAGPDGTPITAQLNRVGTAFQYEPREPLSPVFGLAAIEDWSIANYNSALTIRQGPPREPSGGALIEVRWQGEKTDTSFTLASPAVSVQAGATYQIAIWSRHTMDLRLQGAAKVRAARSAGSMARATRSAIPCDWTWVASALSGDRRNSS